VGKVKFNAIRVDKVKFHHFPPEKILPTSMPITYGEAEGDKACFLRS